MRSCSVNRTSRRYRTAGRSEATRPTARFPRKGSSVTSRPNSAERTGYGEPVREHDPAELESRYEAMTSTRKHLESEGYLVVEPPSLREFVQVWGARDPYASIVARDLGYIGNGSTCASSGSAPTRSPVRASGGACAKGRCARSRPVPPSFLFACGFSPLPRPSPRR
jgi:hypothetical protein